MKSKNNNHSNNPTPTLSKNPNTVTAIGHIDIELIINLSDDLLKKNKIEYDDINSIADLNFLTKEENLLNFLSLHSNNNLVNSLLYLNKTSKEKYKIEFIALNEFIKILKNEDEKFLQEIFQLVTLSYNLNIHEKDIIHESMSKFFITIKNSKKIKNFQLKIEKEEETKNQLDNEEMNIDTNEDIFQKINYENYHTSDFLLFDIEDIISIYPESPQNILHHLITYLESIFSINNKIKIILSYSNLMNQTKTLNLKTVEAILNIFALSDLILFEKKDLYSLFNLIYQIKESEGSENLKSLPHKELTNYILKTLDFVRKTNKVLLILDDFQEISILEISAKKKKIVIEKNKALDLYPKINHTNQKFVEEYKKILKENYTYFRSIFYGGCLSKLLDNVSLIFKSHSNSEKLKIYFISFITGREITKRILEATKNKHELPSEKEFYSVKISNNMINKEIEKENLKSKEDQFILDCINERSSRLKYYHPLYDDHLNFFFSSELNRKQLKEKGFINTNGFIMYDGMYRDVMGSSPKRKNEFESEKKNYGAYKSFSLQDDSKESIINAFASMKVSNSPTERKLPKLSFQYLPQVNLITKGKKRLKPIKKVKVINNLYVNSIVDTSANVNDSKASHKKNADDRNEVNEKMKESISNSYAPKQEYEKEDAVIEDDI